MRKNQIELQVYGFTPPCKLHYLGSLKVGRNATESLHLRPGSHVLFTVFRSSNYFMDTRKVLTTAPFALKSQEGERYLLEAEVDDGAFGRSFYLKTNEDKQDLDPAEFAKSCQSFVEN